MKQWLWLAAAAAMTTAAQAHPGHGSTPPDSVAHYAFEPVHVLPAVMLLAAVAVTAFIVYRRTRRQP